MKIRLGFKCLIGILVLCCILCLYDLSWAGGKNLVLFARNTTFLPEIERILRDLRNYNTNDSIFSSITNLNKWSINRLELGSLDELVRFYESSRELRKKSRSTLKADALFRELIGEADSYVRIDVLPKLSLLEFQLIITDSLPSVKKSEFPIIVTTESRYEGFVIDISREDYHYQLQNSLKRLFPKSNRPPIPRIKLNKEKNEDGYYYFALGRSAILDASESYDFDTPSEHLQFRWAQKNPASDVRPLPDNEIAPLDISSRKQVVSFSKKGEYHFALTVNDGIVDSRQEIIKIRVIDPPYLSAESQYSIKSNGLLSDQKFRIPFSISVKQGESAVPRILLASIRNPRPFLLQKILGKREPRTLDAARYEVNYLASTVNSNPERKDYEVVVQEQSAVGDYQYQFHIIAQNTKCVSDTLDIIVDFQDRDLRFTGTFINFGFFGERNGVATQKRVVGLCCGLRYYLYKDISLGLGKIVPLFEEDIEDSLDIFDTPDMYWALNWKYMSMPIYISHKKTGIGVSIDYGRLFGLFPLSLGGARYGHDHYSANVSTGFEARGSWLFPVFIVSSALFYLSISG